MERSLAWTARGRRLARDYERLPCAPPEGGFAALGEPLDLSAGAARKAIFDWRVRLGELLRDEVLQTVATPAGADEEMRYLLTLL